MSREILFRAKRANGEELPEQKRWIEGLPGYDINGNLTDFEVYKGIAICNVVEIVPETVCEYIGLTDKNGKKIFEGDVVRYNDEIIEKEKVDEVKYNETYAAFCRLHKNEMGLQYLCFNEDIASKCEVVGNIFDNPELLEGGRYE